MEGYSPDRRSHDAFYQPANSRYENFHASSLYGRALTADTGPVNLHRARWQNHQEPDHEQAV